MKSGLFCLALWLLVAPAGSMAASALPPGANYVAMGSSFASGPGVATRVPNSPPGCDRSTQNFAHLLAEKRGLQLVDMSCAGAVTANILDRPQAGQGPQLDGVTAQTRLVTITIGGNDLAYIGNLWSESCINRPDLVPAAWHPERCKLTPAAQVQAAAAQLPQQFHRIVTQIRARAPQAQIVLVDYTNILPAQGECPQRLPLSAQQLQQNRAVAAQLAQITAQAARTEGTKLVTASAVTAAHDVCSADPWVFSFQFHPDPHAFGPIPYHPNAKAMAAIAAAIDQAL